jgi:hypothetical protein
MSKSKSTAYIVLRFDAQFVMLSPFASISRRLGGGEAETMIARSAIVSVAKDGAVLNVTTVDGRAYEIMFGVRKQQINLTRAAFGLPLR